MTVLRTARQDDLNVLIQWIGSPQQGLYWAAPRVSYPIDKAQLAEQIEWIVPMRSAWSARKNCWASVR